ncbi:MAG TPA: hypothetical protein VMJ10_10390 [Kofleriaceae bacterium]|nr:hypothetical protein [Kofleriaceae bacterium]
MRAIYVREHRPRVIVMPPAMRDPRVEVDEKIAPLIKECWRVGLRTLNSCQGNADQTKETSAAYIMFASPLEAIVFAALAGPMSWSQPTRRRRGDEIVGSGEAWRWAHAWWLEIDCVRFPAADIAHATAALRRVSRRLADLIGSAAADVDPIPPDPSRVCPGCGMPLPGSLRRDARYCSVPCRLRARRRGTAGGRKKRAQRPVPRKGGK